MRILFLHGLASSGAYKLADMLRILLRAEVIAPDLPIDPDEALQLLRGLYGTERPDLVAGLSWGGFLALRLEAERTVVINPDLHVSRLLRQHIGRMDYLSPRADGESSFLITEELCRRYEVLEEEGLPSDLPVLGCFAAGDRLVHCSDEFEALFPGRVFRYPGGHLPTYPEVKQHLAPAIRRFLESG